MSRKRKQVVACVLLASAVVLGCLVDVTCANRYEELGQRHQGDIVLTDTQFDAATGGGIPIVYDAFKWEKGIVPYEISPEFTRTQVELITDAMNRISSSSCVRFITRRATDRQYLNVTAGEPGCWATLGMNLLSNRLNLEPDGCLQTGVIVHQLLHVLGLTHPQSRPDRDFFVLVQEDAIDTALKANLNKYQPGTIEDFGIPYDYESILHCQYDAFASSASSRATVIPLDDVEIGQRESMSLKDVRKLNKLYDYEFCGYCLRGNCNTASAEQGG